MHRKWSNSSNICDGKLISEVFLLKQQQSSGWSGSKRNSTKTTSELFLRKGQKSLGSVVQQNLFFPLIITPWARFFTPSKEKKKKKKLIISGRVPQVGIKPGYDNMSMHGYKPCTSEKWIDKRRFFPLPPASVFLLWSLMDAPIFVSDFPLTLLTEPHWPRMIQIFLNHLG